MKEPLTREQIPQGVIDELNDNYGHVIISLESLITETTKSFISNYETIGNEIVEREVVLLKPGKKGDGSDMVNEQVTAIGYEVMGYLVRLDKKGEDVILRRVLETGPTIKPVKTT